MDPKKKKIARGGTGSKLACKLEHHASMLKTSTMSDIRYLAYLDVEGHETD